MTTTSSPFGRHLLLILAALLAGLPPGALVRTAGP